jgi:hypothetical protein
VHELRKYERLQLKIITRAYSPIGSKKVVANGRMGSRCASRNSSLIHEIGVRGERLY